MHCIAAAFDRGEIPGFPVLCVAIGGDGVEAGGGVGRSWVGGIRFFFVRIIFGRLHITQSSKFHKSCHAVAFTYVAAAEARARVFFVFLHLGILGPVYGANLILGASSFSPKRLKREACVMLADAAERFC